MRDFPEVSETLIKALKEAYSNDIRLVKDLDDLHYRKGQQSIIDLLEGIHNKQINQRSKV